MCFEAALATPVVASRANSAPPGSCSAAPDARWETPLAVSPAELRGAAAWPEVESLLDPAVVGESAVVG